MDRIYKKIGLVGSSQIERFPTELLRRRGIEADKISYNPKNAKGLAQDHALEDLATNIIENFSHVDSIFLLIGANDIRKNCNPRDIASNILKICDKIQDLGLDLIVAPLTNRRRPKGMEEPEYNAIRNSVNRRLRNQFRRRGRKDVVLNLKNFELEARDGVHLTRDDYRYLSKVIASHMHKRTVQSLRTAGRHRLNSTEYSVQYLYQ